MGLLTGVLSLLFISVNAAEVKPHYDDALVSLVPSVYLLEPAISEPEELPEAVTRVTELPRECFCVRWIRETFGAPIRGDADTIPSNITLIEANRGDIALFNFNGVYHTAYIKEIRPDRGIRVIQANKKPCAVTEEWISFDNKSITGFHRPPLFLTSKSL